MEMEANTNKETLVKDLHLEKSLDNDDSGAKSTERNKMADKLSMSESEGSDDYVHPLVSRRCAMDDPDQPREDHVIRNVSNVDRKSRDRSRTPRGSSENLLAQIKSDGKGIRKVKKKKIKHSEDGDGTISKEHSMKRRKIKIRKVKCKCNCLCAKHAKAKGQTSIDADGDKANKNQIKGNSKEDTTSVSVSDSLPSQDPNISVEPDLANTDSSKPEVPNKCTCTCSVSSKERKLCPRPDPEGGVSPVTSSHPDEYDAVINSSEPIFSDLEYDAKEDEEIKNELDRHHRRAQSDNIFSAAYLVTSNTMLKFAIIGAELQNIFRGALRRAEGEVGALTRRIRLLEEDFEQTETRLQSASEKLEEASKAADESERGRKVLENRTMSDEERISQLEREIEETILLGEEADRKFEEAARKLAITEVELERAEARLESAEGKILELEEELKVVGNNMKSLEISEQEASQREDTYEETIRGLTQRLKDAENRAAEAERTVSKLQAEVDRLEDDLLNEKEKYKNISEELDATFTELAGF